MTTRGETEDEDESEGDDDEDEIADDEIGEGECDEYHAVGDMEEVIELFE